MNCVGRINLPQIRNSRQVALAGLLVLVAANFFGVCVARCPSMPLSPTNNILFIVICFEMINSQQSIFLPPFCLGYIDKFGHPYPKSGR